MVLLYYLVFMSALSILAIPMWKMGKKTGEAIPYWKYCIPLYNLVLLCRQAKISVLVLIAALASSVILALMGIDSAIIRFVITFLFFGYLSYGLAKKFDLNVLLWSCVGGLFFPLALWRFAFGKTTNVEEDPDTL